MKCYFKDPHHISLIKDGEQQQTTRKASSIKTGDALECAPREGDELIGTAVVTSVIKLRGGLVIERQRDTTQDSWAIREGFSSFAEADKFFSEIYGLEWQGLELDVIYFEGDWLDEDPGNREVL